MSLIVTPNRWSEVSVQLLARKSPISSIGSFAKMLSDGFLGYTLVSKIISVSSESWKYSYSLRWLSLLSKFSSIWVRISYVS